MEKDIRAHVLRVALEELNQCGPAFHMDDLARRLHISKRTLYENFSSKQEIVKNAILSVMDDLYTHHVKLIEDESKGKKEKNKKEGIWDRLTKIVRTRCIGYSQFAAGM